MCLAFADEVLCWLYGTVKESKFIFLLRLLRTMEDDLLNFIFFNNVFCRRRLHTSVRAPFHEARASSSSVLS